MTEAQKILELIENVDPEDSDALDEIDARVYCLLKRAEFVSGGSVELSNKYQTAYTGRQVWYKNEGIEALSMDYGDSFPFYSTSRDALKAIRPEGWNYSVDATAPECLIDFVLYPTKNPDVYKIQQIRGEGKTEELAELHAIIQAIQYERENEQ